jgi:hypothetical protein
VLFVAYGLAVLALSRAYLGPALALAATTLCLLHEKTIFFSDLLFAELPFALVSVGFALVAGGGAPTTRLRETAAFLLAAAGFLLRTVGVVLLAAWVLEALVRRRFRLALTRGLLAVLPIVLWQVHVVHVRASDAYVRPAYEYQRAPYQHYNVGYAENILMVNAFRPELGRADWRELAVRFATNLARMPAALGEAVSEPKRSWTSALAHTQRLLGQDVLPLRVVWLPLLGLGALVVAGIVVFIRRSDWLLASILVLSIALLCVTPWPEEFGRYLMPIAPFLTIAATLPLQRLYIALRARGSRWPSALGSLALVVFLVLLLAFQTLSLVQRFLERDQNGASYVPNRGGTGPRFFYHGPAWLDWEQAAAWIGAHAPSGAIVATIVPHQLYLQTGLAAVYPPMEIDPEQAQRLLESVPVSYVIIDELPHRDFARRYALPAVESHPASWRLVHTVNGTRIFARTPSAESPESKTKLLLR